MNSPEDIEETNEHILVGNGIACPAAPDDAVEGLPPRRRRHRLRRLRLAPREAAAGAGRARLVAVPPPLLVDRVVDLWRNGGSGRSMPLALCKT